MVDERETRADVKERINSLLRDALKACGNPPRLAEAITNITAAKNLAEAGGISMAGDAVFEKVNEAINTKQTLADAQINKILEQQLNQQQEDKQKEKEEEEKEREMVRLKVQNAIKSFDEFGKKHKKEIDGINQGIVDFTNAKTPEEKNKSLDSILVHGANTDTKEFEKTWNANGDGLAAVRENMAKTDDPKELQELKTEEKNLLEMRQKLDPVRKASAIANDNSLTQEEKREKLAQELTGVGDVLSVVMDFTEKKAKYGVSDKETIKFIKEQREALKKFNSGIDAIEFKDGKRVDKDHDTGMLLFRYTQAKTKLDKLEEGVSPKSKEQRNQEANKENEEPAKPASTRRRVAIQSVGGDTKFEHGVTTMANPNLTRRRGSAAPMPD